MVTGIILEVHTVESQFFLQSRPKVVRTLELYHVSPIPLINVGSYRVFSIKKGNNHLIVNIESGGRGELTLCPNYFVRDCCYISISKSIKHTCRLQQCFQVNYLGTKGGYLTVCHLGTYVLIHMPIQLVSAIPEH